MSTERTNDGTVLLRGPFLTNSGYGVHSRQIARWVFDKVQSEKVYAQPLPWGMTPWLLNPDMENGLIGKVIEASKKEPKKHYLTIQVQLPNEWDETLGDVNIGVTAGIESDKVNPSWIPHVHKMDLVIVPSEFSRRAFLALDPTLASKMVVVPESFFDECLTAEPLDLQLSTPFNFLLFGQITGNPETDRKNTFYAIRWFCETFKDNEDVGLVIKTNMSRNSSIDKRISQHVLSQVLMESKLTVNPRVYLLHGTMTNKEVAGLYKNPNIKALFSFTRGEGFGLPLLEAAACGLPVIATNWSAHTEFLKTPAFLTVDYDLKTAQPAESVKQLFNPEGKWAEAREESAKKRLLKFYKDSKIPVEAAKKNVESIVGNYSFEAISKKYDEVLLKWL
jgi:glycosyltransferase involved in cell wall biosynthesis